MTVLYVNKYQRGTDRPEFDVFESQDRAAADAASFEHVYVETLVVLTTATMDLRAEGEDLFAADRAQLHAERSANLHRGY
jgi:hypothetical protein